MTQREHTSICIQDTLHKNKILKLKDCKLWLKCIMQKNSNITIRIVDEKESEFLNYTYRNQKKPTNILSFSLSENPIIGDIILCHPVIKNEASNGLKNEKYTVAMARTSDPDSATSQFFINTSDNSFLDYPGQDGAGYCVFAKVTEGFDIIDKINSVKTGSQNGHQDVPVEQVIIEEVTAD